MTRGRRTRAEQKDATRARLLAVARRAFAEHGYDGVGVGALCRKARMTHGALYHHFSGKEELFAAVVASMFADIAARVRAAARSAEGWSGVEAACDAYLDACAEPDVQRILFRDGPRVLQSTFDDVDRAASAPLVTELLGEWMESGLIRPRPVEALARMLGAAFAEAGALVGEAADRTHARAEVGSLLGDWLSALRRGPGDAPRGLATDRLVLEPWSAADVDALVALFVEEEVRRHLLDGRIVDSGWVSDTVRASEARFARGDVGMYAARNGDRELVGVVGLAELRSREAELVVAVAPAFARRGFGTEMSIAVLREAGARGAPSVRAGADRANAASLRLLEKLGFVRWADHGGTFDYVRARRSGRALNE